MSAGRKDEQGRIGGQKKNIRIMGGTDAQKQGVETMSNKSSGVEKSEKVPISGKG